MIIRVKLALVGLALVVLCGASQLPAQQKPQWVPGQWGLNGGVMPDPGFTYQEITLNYSAGQLNNSAGNPISGITGKYSFWVVENIFFYVPKWEILGAHLAPYVMLPLANGSLTAQGPLGLPLFGVHGGGEGLADMYVQPVNIAWDSKRVDFNIGYGFFAPTGRYSSTRGTTTNVGSGYWGNDFTSGTTFYLTKNKGTSASLNTILEGHTNKQGTNVTPGSAITLEWGLGQILPLDKELHKLFQLGLVGYDQWQISHNSGTNTLGIPASLAPLYSVHAVGAQANLILPPQGFNFFFKYYGEYLAYARPQGRTIIFGGSWTLRVPKPDPGKK